MTYRAPIEALWSVEFGTIGENENPDWGGGVVVLDSGRFMGGDQSFYYLGDYTVKGDAFEVKVNVRRHTDLTDSIFGRLDAFQLEGSGSFEGEKKNIIRLKGSIPDSPNWLVGRLKWLAELP